MKKHATEVAAARVLPTLEMVAKEAFFNVTLPEATWKKAQIEEYLAGFAPKGLAT